MPDINQLIQKLNEYIEKGRAGKQNDPWDIQWHKGHDRWEHRHANYDSAVTRGIKGASRGGWHLLEQNHPSLLGHIAWSKFEHDVLFGGNIPKDSETQIKVKAIREKYGAIKPTEEEFNRRASMEGFDAASTWSPENIPNDLRDQFIAGTPPEAQREVTKRDVGESKKPPAEEEEDIEDDTKEPDESIKEVIPEEKDSAKSAWHIYTIQVKSDSRKKIFEQLQKKGIGVQVHYIPLHFQPFYKNKFKYKKGDFPVAENYYKGAITLPLFPKMTNKEVEYVIGSIKKILVKA